MVTGFLLFCSTWSILPIFNHLAQYWGILLHIHQLGSHYFWLTASIWYILADWVLDNLFIVPEVVLNLVYVSIFSGLAALMSADIARNL